jgi:hypothetical protein
MRCVVIFAGVVLACAAPPPASRRPEANGAPASFAPATFHSTKAPWLEARTEPWSPYYVYTADGEIAGLGGRVALVVARVGTRSSVVALHEERGVLGIVDKSESYWLGIDGADALYRVLDDGAFERANDAVAASNGAWEPRASVPAGLFAAAGSVVAAAGRNAVYVSVDGAASFRKSVPRADASVHELYVRHDGVLVVSVRRENGRDELFVSSDRGAHWARSSLQSGGLDQTGAWIYSHCAQAVLSLDGKTWIEHSSLEFDMQPLSRAIEIDEELAAYPTQPRLNQTLPPAPSPADGRKIAGEHPCGGGRVTRAPRVRMGGPSLPACRGVECLRYRRQPFSYPTPTRIKLFQDGLCAPRDGRENQKCALTDPLVRAPHALVLDNESKNVEVVDLPAGCRPLTVRSGGGISVLTCFDGERSLFVADRSGTWRAESALLVSESSTTNPLQVASDGSLLFHDDLGDVRLSRAWVRAPLPLGSTNAWRRIEHRDVAGYSIAPGGRVLVATVSEGDTVDRFTLWLDEPGRPARKLGRLDTEGRGVLDVCGGSRGVRLLLDSERGFEVHTLENGRLVWLGNLPIVSSGDRLSDVEDYSAQLCSDDLAILKSVMNGAARR